MGRYWVIIAFLAGGCLASNGLQYEAMSETNQYHLARVRKGMSQKQVLQIMHKPYSYETFEVEDDIYDVWFYVTRPTALDQTRMVPQNLTPLTFKNGVLVGTGYQWYYYAMKEQAGEVSLRKPPVEKPKTQKDEDDEFEKSLRAIPQEKPAAQPIEKKGPEKEKLPPNVHIISQGELNSESKESEQDEITADPCCKPCPCPTKMCGPERFSALSNGMTESQVFQIFGEPLKYDTFQVSTDVYDAWFYDTIASKTGNPSIVPQAQTILTFKNAVLISTDDEKYFELKGRAATQISVQTPQQTASLVAATVKDFSSVKLGMTESEVMDKLGATEEQDTIMDGDDVYNVWFYKVGKRTIPLTFKNGTLISKTVEGYNQVKGKCTDCYDKAGERMEQDASEQNFNYW
ncbi:MAG: DUF3192 domain-containing protein [Parachlamydiales bacterium]|nr:DUF3192 domain-containing protein [Parachlamydiales bacterium]